MAVSGTEDSKKTDLRPFGPQPVGVRGITLSAFHRLAETDDLDYSSIMLDILVIDDDVVFLETLAEAMTRGHRDINIKTATTAEQGLRLLGRQHFDAVISDFRMPG